MPIFPVHAASIVTGCTPRRPKPTCFRQKASLPKLKICFAVRSSMRWRSCRAQALRQAMLQLIDGPGLVIDGKPAYSYAHPMFWAPFALAGEGANR